MNHCAQFTNQLGSRAVYTLISRHRVIKRGNEYINKCSAIDFKVDTFIMYLPKSDNLSNNVKGNYCGFFGNLLFSQKKKKNDGWLCLFVSFELN